MEILRALNMINIRTFLTLLTLCSHIRAKKLCDVRIWYLNIFTADIFNRDMTEEQMSLKESIEALVLNAADNRNSKMVDCSALYMYNEMLKEQFNFEGIPLKEVDSDQSSQVRNDQLLKDDKGNIDDENHETTLQSGENETDESSELAPATEKSMEQTSEDNAETNDKNNDSENESDEQDITSETGDEFNQEDEEEAKDSSDEYQSIRDITEYDEDTNVKLSTEDNQEDNDFADLTDIYSDDSDITDIDDTYIDDDYNTYKTDRVNEEIVGVEDTYHNSETINKSSLHTFKQNPFPFGVCWSFGCSKYDLLISDTDQYVTKSVDFSNGAQTKKKPKEKNIKLDPIDKCTLSLYYENLYRKTLCLRHYSLESENNENSLYSYNSESNVEHSDNLNTDERSQENMQTQRNIESDDIMEVNDRVDQQNKNIASNEDAFNYDSTDNAILDDAIHNDIIWNEVDEDNNGNTKDNENNVDTENNRPDQSSTSEVKDRDYKEKTANKDSNEDRAKQQVIGSLKEFEDLIEQKATKYFMKVQTLEVMIMKLENQLLSEAMDKQNHSSTITKLENHILKLENELLKMSKNYQNLQEEAENISNRQTKYLELAYKQQKNSDYQELPDHTSKSKELITQHQSKLQELAFVLKNQSKTMLLLQEKYESLEEQNRQLHQMVMNQTIFMTTIIKTVQDLSEQNIQNQKEILSLRKMIDEKETLSRTSSQSESNANIIDELESLLFQNKNEKNNVHTTDEGSVNIEAFEPSEKHLENEVMRTNRNKNTDLVSSWCPKSANTCPQCQQLSVTKANCIPFQFILWSSDIHRNTHRQYSTDIKPLSEANSPMVQQQATGTELPELDPQADSSDTDSELETKVEGISKDTNNKQDEYDENESISENTSPTDDQNQYIQRPSETDNESKPDHEQALYQLVGYDKDGKPVYKMRNVEVVKPESDEEQQTNEEKTDGNIGFKDKSNSVHDKHVAIDAKDKPEEKHISDDNKTAISKEQQDSHSYKRSESESSDSTEVKQTSNENKMSEQPETNINHKHSQDDYGDNNIKNDNVDNDNNKIEIKDKLLRQDDVLKYDKDNSITRKTANKENMIETDVPSTKTKSEQTETNINQHASLNDNDNDDGNAKLGHEIKDTDNTVEMIDGQTTKDTIETNKEDGKSDSISSIKYNTLPNDRKITDNKIVTKESGAKDENKPPKDAAVLASSKPHDDKQMQKSGNAVVKERHVQEPDNGKSNKQGTIKEVENIKREAKDTKIQDKVETSKSDAKRKDTNKNQTLDRAKSKGSDSKSKEKKLPQYLKTNTGRQSEAKDCYDHYSRGDRRDGIYKIKPLASDKSVEVFCDMRKGGWTVIQRRQDGSTNFFQDWNSYKKGFGGLYGEHWLGNDNIHLLTNQDYYKLQVSLMNWDKEKKYAEFDYFIVENEEEGYRINIDGYSGDAGDGFTKHNGNRFSTKDVDNDKLVKEMGGSCAKRFNGAGWYYKCYASNLNGKYYKGGKIPEKQYDGVTWKPWTGPNYSLKKVEMKIIPVSVKTKNQ
ncbi:Fibrinogen C domain containing 1 [Mactra antiquata]